MSVMGSTYSTNTFTLSPKPAFCARSGTTKEVGGGHWGGAEVKLGCWAAGLGCELSCGEQAWPKGQALAFADLTRGLGAVGVAHIRSALGLSRIYRQQKGWLPLLRKTSAAALA
jgi:hypothetical protein